MKLELYIILFLIIFIVMYVIIIYNKLLKLKNRIREQWSIIDVELKKRFDLIPNLIQVVKESSKYEKETLTSIINSRNIFLNSNTKEDEIKADNSYLKNYEKIFLLQEKYPDLKANDNYIALINNLKEIEDKIAFSRKFYNEIVLKYLNCINTFPSLIVARMFGFKEELFFKNEDERQSIKVNLKEN